MVKTEFAALLVELGVKLTRNDLDLLWIATDEDGNGTDVLSVCEVVLTDHTCTQE